MIFSVIIPTFNRKDKLAKCLYSLYQQTLARDKFEIIVVDDASTDGTYRYLVDHKVHVFRMPSRQGPAKARNFGAQAAKGKYLAFIDSDCEAPKNWLDCILKGYKTYPNVVGVGGIYKSAENNLLSRYDDLVYQMYVKKSGPYLSDRRDEAPFVFGNISYTREIFRDLGGMSEKIPYFCSGEDAEFKEKVMKKRKKVLFIHNPVIHNYDHTFNNFYNQCLQRGAGRLLDSKRKGSIQSKISIFSRLILTPVYFVYSTLKLKGKIHFSAVDTLFYVFSNLGKINYYDSINEIKL